MMKVKELTGKIMNQLQQPRKSHGRIHGGVSSNGGNGDRDRDDSWSRHQWRQPNETPSLKYGVSSQASAEGPDKFSARLRGSLDVAAKIKFRWAERATIISSLKNEFTTSRVTEALRLNWPEDDLKRRGPISRISLAC